MSRRYADLHETRPEPTSVARLITYAAEIADEDVSTLLDACEVFYMNGGADDTCGDVDGPLGHFYRVDRFIVHTCSQGISYATERETIGDAVAYMGETADEIAELEIDTDDYAATCERWHGGQESAMYALLSSGCYQNAQHAEDVADEARADQNTAGGSVGRERDALAALIADAEQYVERHAPTGFALDVKLGNAAMRDADDVADLLDSIAAKLRSGIVAGNAHDTNGNAVGSWAIVVD